MWHLGDSRREQILEFGKGSSNGCRYIYCIERKYYICVHFNNAIKVPDTIDEMPNSGNEVPDKTETVPNTMKRMPDSGNEVPDTTEEMPDSEQEQQIYKYVLENSSITTAETVEILDVKHRRARAVLLNMVKDGYLRKEGAARSTIYVKNTEGR